MRERERESERVCVCERERERERVCVYEREGESMCICQEIEAMCKERRR